MAVALYFATKEAQVAFEGHVTVNCTPQRAFDFLKDPSNLMKIHPFLSAVQTAEFQKLGDGVEYKKLFFTQEVPLFYGHTHTATFPVDWTTFNKNRTVMLSFSTPLARVVASTVVTSRGRSS